MRTRPLVACLAAFLLGAGASGCDLRSKEVRRRDDAIRAAVETSPERVNAPFEGGLPPLHIAVLNGAFELMTWLLERGAEPGVLDAGGHSALHLALLLPAEDHRALRTLLASGADPNVRNAGGETPLHDAAYGSRAAALDLLLAAHADPRARSPSGATALHLAATPQPGAADSDVARVVRALVAAGGEVDARDAAQRTALMLAALHGHAGAARALLREGANAGAHGPGGVTALHIAAGMGAATVADVLLAAQADPNARDDEGLTPLATARQRPARRFAAEGAGPVDTTAVVHLLLQHGGVELPAPPPQGKN